MRGLLISAIGALLIVGACGGYNRRDCYVSGTECESSSPPTDDSSGPSTVSVPGPTGASGQNGSSCSAFQETDGVSVVCSNGTRAFVNKGERGDEGRAGQPVSVGPSTVGPKGEPGDEGSVGTAGSSCSATPVVGGVLISCTNGTNAVVLNGHSGTDGQAGVAGTSCSASATGTGVHISCGDGTSAEITNGNNGAIGQPGSMGPTGSPGNPGAAGAAGQAITELINPCPGRQWSEILLRLSDDTLIAHYASGANQFLTVVVPGSYMLTDGSGCTFTVNASLDVTDNQSNTWLHHLNP